MSEQTRQQKERLQKVLARAGVASRRACEELIEAGRVEVSGQLAVLGMRVGRGDEIRLDGRILPAEELWGRLQRTFMLHKPAGYVTTASDELGRRNVLEAMPKVAGLHPVGRLDLDSEGLLILTTDGKLTEQLTHPRYEHEKAYRVWTRPALGKPEQTALRRGVELEDGFARAEVALLAGGGAVMLREGRKRQVRRMCEAVGCPVTRLLRYRVGGLWLGDLQAGEYAELTEQELAWLMQPYPAEGDKEQEHQEALTKELWF